jgi:membrane protease YdiL (CAAX protease family)
MTSITHLNPFVVAWNRFPIFIRAIITGFLVSSVGIAFWTVFRLKIPAPWCVIPMVIALWVYLKWFSGSWRPETNQVTRKNLFRSGKLSPTGWLWGLMAALCFVIIVQASFVITFRIFEFPAAKFTADYKVLDQMPIRTAWVIIIMSSIVAGVCEETGFRGYMQVSLERKWGAAAAIIVTSFVFMLIHLSHSWAAPILPHIFIASVLLGILAYRSGSLIPGIVGHSILDIFDYSVWWSDITGGFRKQTVFKTGIDLDFIFWILTFILALFVFFKAVGRLKIKNDKPQ